MFTKSFFVENKEWCNVLGLFRKKATTVEICSPVNGWCMDLSEVEDPVFSEKMMGEGTAVKPEENKVKAPCSGRLSMIFPTKHAFGITTDDGVGVLVHIGLDTVELNGRGFRVFKTQNDRIKKGETVVEFDETYLKDKAYNMTTMVIVTDPNGSVFAAQNINKMVKSGEVILLRAGK